MAPIITTADIDRPVADVFAYATDPFRFTEWQQGVVDGHMDGPQPPAVGASSNTCSPANTGRIASSWMGRRLVQPRVFTTW